MDTNTNYKQYSGDISNLLKQPFGVGDLYNLDNAMGITQGDQPTFIQNGNIYQVRDAGSGRLSLSQIDTVGNRQAEAAQQLYQQQQGSAISTLQTGKGNLAQQYSDLLSTVKGEYQPLINQQTVNTAQQLAQRGILPGAGLYDNTMTQSLQPIYGQEAANAQQIGAGSIADINTYNQAISQAQQGGAQFGATLPLQYGQLALAQQALPSQIGLTQAQTQEAQTAAKFVPTAYGGNIFNTSSGGFQNPLMNFLLGK